MDDDVSLPASVTEVVRGDTHYFIIGTAHVSQRSVDEVRQVIAQVKPDVVAVELCKGRHDALTKNSAFRELDVFKVVREGKTLYLLAHLALSSYQRKIGASLGVKPGAELLAAVNAANDNGIPVELIDRDINVTLKRTWRNLGLWKRSTLLTSLFVGWDSGKGEPVDEKAIESLKEPKALSEMLSELGKAVPEIKAPLIDERDTYLASKLTDSPGRRIVAVVGAAHVPGMLPQIGQVIDRAPLDKIPPPSLFWTALKWLVPLLFVAALIYGWKWSDNTSFSEMMLAWILPTSIGAAGLTLLAGGSILSVLTALVVAPIAAIHPLLGTGMVVGIVEAWRRKPSVADCERLPEDIQSLRGFWRNPVTRILLIAVASGLGTAAGFWVGVGWVASLL
ncbi:MAG: TraB/GumN family protein [Deltaproteobacteria bacterium]|nr:TraB/GumN family protein [Deltaproteobacteria bacterium]